MLFFWSGLIHIHAAPRLHTWKKLDHRRLPSSAEGGAGVNVFIKGESSESKGNTGGSIQCLDKKSSYFNIAHSLY